MEIDPRSVLREATRVGASSSGEPDFDRVVVEEPLEIRVAGEPIAVTMRTPGDDRELAVGFLVTEGVLSSATDVLAVEHARDGEFPGNVIEVRVADGVDAGPAKRAMYSSSSCGLCGKGTIAAITRRVAPITREEDPVPFSLDVLLSMPAKMRAAQPTFDRTGGLHAAALFDRQGDLLVLREDIGRHNAVDKVIGARILAGETLGGLALMISGRAGFEILQKAAVARIPLVAAVSAPSSLAIDLADRAGITLLGFLRPPRGSVYTHARRVS